MGPQCSKPKKKNQINPIGSPQPLTINPNIPIKEFRLEEFLIQHQPNDVKPQIYKDGHWQEVAPEGTQELLMESAQGIESLEIVTYNIWFGTRMETVEEIKPRISGLMSIVQSKNPHIICLQEMTETIKMVIESLEWVQKSYWIAGNRYPSGYGITILSRLPAIRLIEQKFPTKLGRSLLITQFEINSETLSIGTVHLESYARDNEIRKRQLHVSKEILTKLGGNSMLMGDFNFKDNDECLELSNFLSPPYIDVWKHLRPDEVGFTYDMQANIMLNETLKMKGRDDSLNRIDLIFSHFERDQFKPSFIELIGTEEILKEREIPSGETKETIFPSDHFGIHATFIPTK